MFRQQCIKETLWSLSGTFVWHPEVVVILFLLSDPTKCCSHLVFPLCFWPWTLGCVMIAAPSFHFELHPTSWPSKHRSESPPPQGRWAGLKAEQHCSMSFGYSYWLFQTIKSILFSKSGECLAAAVWPQPLAAHPVVFLYSEWVQRGCPLVSCYCLPVRKSIILDHSG